MLGLVQYMLCRAQLHDSAATHRSEEHTSELQSQSNLVCRLLLEKKKKITIATRPSKTFSSTFTGRSPHHDSSIQLITRTPHSKSSIFDSITSRSLALSSERVFD